MITPAKAPSTQLTANPHQHLTLVIQTDRNSCTSNSVSFVVPIVRVSASPRRPFNLIALCAHTHIDHLYPLATLPPSVLHRAPIAT